MKKSILIGMLLLSMVTHNYSALGAEATLQQGPIELSLDTFAAAPTLSYPSYTEDGDVFSIGLGAGALLKIPSYPRSVVAIQNQVALSGSVGGGVRNSDLTNTVFELRIYRGTNNYQKRFSSPWQAVSRMIGDQGLYLTAINSTQNRWTLGFTNLPPFVMGTNRVYSVVSFAADSMYPYTRIALYVNSTASSRADFYTTDLDDHLVKRNGAPAVRVWSRAYLSSSNVGTLDRLFYYIPGLRVVASIDDPAGPYALWSEGDGSGVIPVPDANAVFLRSVIDTVADDPSGGGN